MAFSLHVHASDDVSGCVQLAPDSTEVAGIVERYRTVVLGLGKFALGLKVIDELGVVHDFDVLAAVVLVLLTQRVEAVRTGGNDLFHADFFER